MRATVGSHCKWLGLTIPVTIGYNRMVIIRVHSIQSNYLKGETVMSIQSADINDKKTLSDDIVAKVNLLKTDNLTLDVYYYKAGQALGYHRHPTGDQMFTVIAGTGTFKLDDGKEESIEVKPGSTFLAPLNVWHDLIDSGDGQLIAQQVTKQPSGMEKR